MMVAGKRTNLYVDTSVALNASGIRADRCGGKDEDEYMDGVRSSQM